MSDCSKGPRKRVPDEMAVIDADRCTGCAACVEICPVDCIVLLRLPSQTAREERLCEIDWDRCIGCRMCIRLAVETRAAYRLQVCPWDAIRMVAVGRLLEVAAGLGGPASYLQAGRKRLEEAARREVESAPRD